MKGPEEFLFPLWENLKWSFRLLLNLSPIYFILFPSMTHTVCYYKRRHIESLCNVGHGPVRRQEQLLFRYFWFLSTYKYYSSINKGAMWSLCCSTADHMMNITMTSDIINTIIKSETLYINPATSDETRRLSHFLCERI